MARKLFSSTFGNVFYNSGVVGPGVTAPVGETIDRAGSLSVSQHDDRFYEDSAGVISNQAGVWMTYDFHDLRDLLEEGECLADVGVNIQRLRECPKPEAIYNMPAVGGNIHETIIITNSRIQTNYGALTGDLIKLFKAGFQGLTGSTNANNGQLDDMREIIYAEHRIYGQDTSQIATSPDQMGGMGGPTPTRWCGNLLLLDRTVTGQADLVIGPNITIMRVFQIVGRDRGVQQQASPPGVEAGELTNNFMQIAVSFPPILINIIGDKRKMNKTEKAIEYSNVFLNNQNPVPR